MFLFLTVVQAIIAAALVGVILMQRSEGGALGTGGSPGGLMSARGAADFLTRTTTVLATLFVSLSIIMAVMAAGRGSGSSIDQTLERDVPSATPEAALPPPADDDPLSAISGPAAGDEAPASEEAPPAQ